MTALHRRTVKRFNIPHGVHELTFSCQDKLPLLRFDPTCHLLADAINSAAERHTTHIWSYVFMPNHVHILVYFHTDTYSVSRFLQAIKQPVARRGLVWLKANAPSLYDELETKQAGNPRRFWLAGGGYDRNMTTLEAITLATEYIHNNPLRRDLANCAEDYGWSSASTWANGVPGKVTLNLEYYPR